MSVIQVALLSTCLFQAGNLCWKIAADRRNRLGLGQRALLSSRMWWAGTFATVCGWVLFVVAASLGDISLVQPVISIGDVLLVLASVLWLNERLRIMEWAGVALVMTGVWLLTGQVHTSAQPTEWAVLAVITVAVAMVGALPALLRRLWRNPVLMAGQVGLALGIGAVLTKALLSVPWAWDQAGLWKRASLVVAVIIANGIGMWRIQDAFMFGRAAIVVPVVLAAANLVAFLGGGFALGESVDGSRLAAAGAILAGTALFLAHEPGVASHRRDVVSPSAPAGIGAASSTLSVLLYDPRPADRMPTIHSRTCPH